MCGWVLIEVRWSTSDLRMLVNVRPKVMCVFRRLGWSVYDVVS